MLILASTWPREAGFANPSRLQSIEISINLHCRLPKQVSLFKGSCFLLSLSPLSSSLCCRTLLKSTCKLTNTRWCPEFLPLFASIWELQCWEQMLPAFHWKQQCHLAGLMSQHICCCSTCLCPAETPCGDHHKPKKNLSRRPKVVAQSYIPPSVHNKKKILLLYFLLRWFLFLVLA